MNADVNAPPVGTTRRQRAVIGMVTSTAVMVPLVALLLLRLNRTPAAQPPRHPHLSPGPLLDGIADLAAPLALLGVLAAVAGAARAVHRYRRSHRDRPTAPRPVEPAASGHADLVAAAEEALARRDIIGGQVAVLVIDVAEPERVPVVLGPDGPADVARQAIRRMRAWLPPQDTVVQLGPSSFGVVTEGLGDVGEPDGALRVASRLALLLDEPMSSGYRLAEIPFVAGIATSRLELDHGEALLQAAAHAQQQARVTGVGLGTASARPTRTIWRHYDLAQHARALAQDTLRVQLSEALQAQRIQAVFRPIVALLPTGPADEADPDGIDLDPTGPHGAGRIGHAPWVAVEALPRWLREDGTSLPPEQLEQLIDAPGLALELDRQLLERGLDAVSAWYAAGFPVGRLAVRLNGELLRHPNLPAALLAQLNRRDLPPTCLVVELDAAQATEPEALRPVLAELRMHGMEVVITSVVSPKAGAALARTLPVTGISLHPSVTEAMTRSSVPVAAAVTACHRAGVRCLAEGVATPEQLEAARRLRFDAVSGPLTGHPAGARDLSARFSETVATTYS